MRTREYTVDDGMLKPLEETDREPATRALAYAVRQAGEQVALGLTILAVSVILSSSLVCWAVCL